MLMKPPGWNRTWLRVLLGLAVGLCVVGVLLWPRLARWHAFRQAEQALAGGDLAAAEAALLPYWHDTDTEQMQAAYLYAQVSRRQQKLGRARRALTVASRLGLDDARAVREHTLIEAAAGNFDAVGGSLYRLHEENPDDEELAAAVARFFLKMHAWDRAIQTYSHLLQRHPDRAEYYLRRGEAWINAKDYRQAAADYRRYLQYFPGDYDARYNLACCLLYNLELDAGEQERDRCRQLQSERLENHLLDGLIAFLRGNLPAAEKAFRRVLETQPQHPLALKYLGDVYLLSKRPSEAVGAFERFLALFPDDPEAHGKLARALEERNDPRDRERIQKHREFFQRAVREKYLPGSAQATSDKPK